MSDDSPVSSAIDRLVQARGLTDPEEAADIRDEVRVIALLLIAEELSHAANSLERTAQSVALALSTIQPPRRGPTER